MNIPGSTRYNRYANVSYQKHCLWEPVFPSLLWGAGFSAIDAMQGARITPLSVAQYCSFIWAYHAVQCPMEAIHGRKSLWHNVIAAGSLGAAGVASRRIGVPLVSPQFYYMYPQFRPVYMGFLVYGAMGGVFGGLSGKRF